LSTSTINPADLDGINEQYRNILSKVAEDAIPLTDSFGFTDRELNSALGKKDGNVYEALWERVQRNPINKGGISAVLRVSFFIFIFYIY
jgi:acyl-CoA oxidase